MSETFNKLQMSEFYDVSSGCIHYICSASLTDSPHEFPDSYNSKSSVNQIIRQEGAQKNHNDCAKVLW